MNDLEALRLCRDALLSHGFHDDDCPISLGGDPVKFPCDCIYGDALAAADAVLALPEEIEQAELARQRDVIRSLNARCDHLGIRLGEVIRERDAAHPEPVAVVRELHTTGIEWLKSVAIGSKLYAHTTPVVTLPPLPEWSKMDNLGALVPSEVRTALREYATAALRAAGVEVKP